MIARRPRWGAILLGIVLAGGAASIGISAIRQRLLRATGWALVVNDHIEPADTIVVAIEADGAGVLEAADLIHSGMAKRVAIFTGSPDPVGREFIRRGVPYEDEAARSVRQLRSLGVETIDQIPGSVRGTEDQGPVLADWCDRQGFRSVIVVSTADHSRRLRRMLHRFLKGHHTRVMVNPGSARYPHFDPDRWWESRGGVRVEIEEGGKLLLDVLRHPISRTNPNLSPAVKFEATPGETVQRTIPRTSRLAASVFRTEWNKNESCVPMDRRLVTEVTSAARF